MRLKELRKNNKLKQSELAKILNIPLMTYNNYENEKSQPSIEILNKIADYYNISLDYLVERNYGNQLGFLTDEQITFVKTFLALNTANQMSAIIYVANLLANQ